MLSITKKADYGLIFLHELALADPQAFIPLKRIAKDANLPYKFLSQIAGELRNGQLVESREGLGGGYRLLKSAGQISIGDILTVLEGPTAPVACLRGKACKRELHCPHRHVMQKLAAAVDQSMNACSLADLVN